MSKYFGSKGLTMIELMLAIVIAGIITSAIGGFLMVHIRSYEISQDLIDIQYEAQIALNGMSEMAMESRGLYEVQSRNGGSLINDTLDNDGFVADVRLIAFQGLEVGGIPEYHVFVKEADSSEFLFFSTTNAAITDEIGTFDVNGNLTDIGEATMFARNIKKVSVIATQINHSSEINGLLLPFQEAEGIEIIFTLERGESTELEVRTIAKYRNLIPD